MTQRWWCVSVVILVLLVGPGACTYPARTNSSVDSGAGVNNEGRDAGTEPDARPRPDAEVTPDADLCEDAGMSCGRECVVDEDCGPGGMCAGQEFCDECGCCESTYCELVACPGACYMECYDEGDCQAGQRCYAESFCDPYCGCCETSWCEPAWCGSDDDCETGTVCFDGQCEPCYDVLPVCDLWCPAGYAQRNGCSVCACESECNTSSDCADGWTCIPGPICNDLCASGDPSCCEGNWCAPTPGCEGPNPACDPTRSCNPSSCVCSNGQWECTSDCGPMGLGCDSVRCGPIPGCVDDQECGPGGTCVPVNRCAPRECTCAADGVWDCFADCGGGVCMRSADFCPHLDSLGCNTDTDCYSGFVCVQSPPNLCPQSCYCDPTTATWGCDDACSPGLCILPE